MTALGSSYKTTSTSKSIAPKTGSLKSNFTFHCTLKTLENGRGLSLSIGKRVKHKTTIRIYISVTLSVWCTAVLHSQPTIIMKPASMNDNMIYSQETDLCFVFGTIRIDVVQAPWYRMIRIVLIDITKVCRVANFYYIMY